MKKIKRFDEFINEEMNPFGGSREIAKLIIMDWSNILDKYKIVVKRDSNKVLKEDNTYDLYKKDDQKFFLGTFAVIELDKNTLRFKYYEGGLENETPEEFNNIEDMLKYIKTKFSFVQKNESIKYKKNRK